MTSGFLRGRLPDPDGAPVRGEAAERVLEHGRVVIEHILSGTLERPVAYDQAEDEWVVLLSGRARLRVAGEPVTLTAGDWLFLPAGLEHELAVTAAGARWLAVFVDPRP
jgi:cupin 2 domain-containing protein